MTEFNPQPGDRCHWRLWTDVEPCTVIRRTVKTVTVRLDKAELAKPPKLEPGGFAAIVVEPADWVCVENPEGRTMTFSLRKSGVWKRQGAKTGEVGDVLWGGWRKFHDYGF